MSEHVLVVFTAKSRETIIEDGGISSSILDPGAVGHFKYVVCARNGHCAEGGGTGPRGPESHGAGFLVGRISDVKKVGQRNRRDQFLVVFDSTADINVPAVWDGFRFPLRYVQLADLEAKGIDFDRLHFAALESPPKPAPAPRPQFGAVSSADLLTIAEAKRSLAAKFRVTEDDIEITIKGLPIRPQPRDTQRVEAVEQAR